MFSEYYNRKNGKCVRGFVWNKSDFSDMESINNLISFLFKDSSITEKVDNTVVKYTNDKFLLVLDTSSLHCKLYKNSGSSWPVLLNNNTIFINEKGVDEYYCSNIDNVLISKSELLKDTNNIIEYTNDNRLEVVNFINNNTNSSMSSLLSPLGIYDDYINKLNSSIEFNIILEGQPRSLFYGDYVAAVNKIPVIIKNEDTSIFKSHEYDKLMSYLDDNSCRKIDENNIELTLYERVHELISYLKNER